MPAPLNVDREAVRTLVVAIGVRAASRQLNLPEGTVQAWSARGKWLAHTRQPKPLLPASMQGATTAIQPADALVKQITEDGEAAKLHLGRATRKFAEHIAKMKPSLSKDRAMAAKSWAGVGSSVFGWEAKQAGNGFTLNLLSIGGEMNVNA